jgi:hypothetical protein
MADPGRAVDLRGTAAVNGAAAARDTEALVAQIERTREELARTVDSLAERVSPANNLRRLRERGLEQIGRPDVQLALVAVGLALAGFAVYRLWGGRRK